MAWKIEWDERAIKDAKKLGTVAGKRIIDYLNNRVITAADPRVLGKPLAGNMEGLWRYRVGDYRIICNIEDKKLKILVIAVGHRKEIYD